MKRILLSVLILSFIFQFSNVKAQLVEKVYNFNNLPITDTLNGKDGWKSVKNTVYGGDFSIKYSSGSTLTPDASLGAFYAHGGPNVGQTASRKTSTNFPFDFSIGGVMEFEAQIFSAYWGTSFGVGYDADNSGIISGTNEGGISMLIHTKLPVGGTFIKPDGTSIAFTYDSIPEWNTYKFLVDFDAYNGQGSLTLFAKRPNAANFIIIPQVNNINLGLTPGSNNKLDPAKWLTLFIHSTGGVSGFDNLKIRQPNTGGLQYQYIIFNSLPKNILTTNPPITLHATTNKHLPVSYTVIGPATIVNDSILTLTGDTGTIVVIAHQPGNATVGSAADVPMSTYVVNPNHIFPELEINNPVNFQVVRAPYLDPIPLSMVTSIDYSDLLHITNVYFTINSQNLQPDSTSNGYFLKYWTPPAFGTYTISASAVSSGGNVTTKSVTFDVVPDSTSFNYTLLNAIHFADYANHILDTTLTLPSFTGAYKKVTAHIQYNCPPEGCEPWDVVGYVYVRGANGEWVELLRYVTPYGKACQDSVDVTDFVSQLQGRVDFTADFPSKSKVTITFKYKEGRPSYKTSWVEKLWLGSYSFGGWGVGTTNGLPSIQPVETRNLKLSDPNITAAYLRLVTTGHGSGSDNTGNAAEFFNATHNIKVNGTTVYTQHLWRNCNPNPAGCSNQAGTWQYPRAGWCPGSIPMQWWFNLTSNLGSNVDLNYEFHPSYVNLCTASNPNCVDGVTCSSCAGGNKPNYMVAGELIKFYGGVPTYHGIEEIPDYFGLQLYPNPSDGIFNLSAGVQFTADVKVEIFNIAGVLLNEMKWNGEPVELNLTGFSNGIYLLKVSNDKSVSFKKIIVQ